MSNITTPTEEQRHGRPLYEAHQVIRDLLGNGVFADPTTRLAIIVNFLEELVDSDEFWQAFEDGDWQRDIKWKLINILTDSDATQNLYGKHKYASSLLKLVTRELKMGADEDIEDDRYRIISAGMTALGHLGNAEIFLELDTLCRWSRATEDPKLRAERVGAWAAGLSCLLKQSPAHYGPICKSLTRQRSGDQLVEGGLREVLATVIAEATNTALRDAPGDRQLCSMVTGPWALPYNDRPIVAAGRRQLYRDVSDCVTHGSAPSSLSNLTNFLVLLGTCVSCEYGFICTRTGHRRWIEKVRMNGELANVNPITDQRTLGLLSGMSISVRQVEHVVGLDVSQHTESYEALVVPINGEWRQTADAPILSSEPTLAYIVLYKRRDAPFTVDEMVFVAICGGGLARALPYIAREESGRVLHLLEMPSLYWRIMTHDVNERLEQLHRNVADASDITGAKDVVLGWRTEFERDLSDMSKLLQLLAAPTYRTNVRFDELLASAVGARMKYVDLEAGEIPEVYLVEVAARHVIHHLIQNAVENSDGKKISVRVELIEQSPLRQDALEYSSSDSAWLMVQVTNKPDNWDSAFQNLNREDLYEATDPRVERHGGFGLPLCKTIAKALGGDLDVTPGPSTQEVVAMYKIPCIPVIRMGGGTNV